jgi:hypothetical protein
MIGRYVSAKDASKPGRRNFTAAHATTATMQAQNSRLSIFARPAVAASIRQAAAITIDRYPFTRDGIRISLKLVGYG